MKKRSVEKDQAKADRIEKLVARIKQSKGLAPRMTTAVPKEALPEEAADKDRHRLLAHVALFGVHRWYIGRVDLPAETKLDWDGLHCRDHWFEFNGNMSHPDLEKILSDINECMQGATAAAIAAGVFTGNLAAATAAFKTALVACLKLKGIGWAEEIGVWITQDEMRGDWHYCL